MGCGSSTDTGKVSFVCLRYTRRHGARDGFMTWFGKLEFLALAWHKEHRLLVHPKHI
jgi:hypothetical protein